MSATRVLHFSLMPSLYPQGSLVHPTLDDALSLARSYSSDSGEHVEAIADYAFSHQVPIYHAAWAINVHSGLATTCSCTACEREGFPERIHQVEQAAWSVRAKELDASHRPAVEWQDEVNTAAKQAGLAEAHSILQDLESAFPAIEDTSSPSLP